MKLQRKPILLLLLLLLVSSPSLAQEGSLCDEIEESQQQALATFREMDMPVEMLSQIESLNEQVLENCRRAEAETILPPMRDEVIIVDGDMIIASLFSTEARHALGVSIARWVNGDVEIRFYQSK